MPRDRAQFTWMLVHPSGDCRVSLDGTEEAQDLAHGGLCSHALTNGEKHGTRRRISFAGTGPGALPCTICGLRFSPRSWYGTWYGNREGDNHAG